MTLAAALKTAKAITVAAASLCVALVLVGRDAEFCLCEPDPDGCGHACHVCTDGSAVHAVPAVPASFGDSMSEAADDCRHVHVFAGDLLCTDGRVVPSAAPEVIPAAIPGSVLTVRSEHGRVLPSTAPPERGGDLYVNVVTRLFPRA